MSVIKLILKNRVLLSVFTTSVVKSITKRPIPPPIRNVLSNFLSFAELAAHVVAVVRRTVITSVILRSKADNLSAKIHVMSPPQNHICKTMDQSVSCCFFLIRKDAVAIAPHEINSTYIMSCIVVRLTPMR